ncbi:hypothetical protein NE619_02905 [Anaerovorax odorimutans]|uniref:Uncharacterized protein n=1 Tax=Anaerovorax odorimutans TaxID=109327 RepID=A0ABT1RL30_9FIRM|nr:hypothetical protein [Anaerovorax odorimutans]
MYKNEWAAAGGPERLNGIGPPPGKAGESETERMKKDEKTR